jgi:hypothetical protein
VALGADAIENRPSGTGVAGLAAARGVILRGAGWAELQTHVLVLWAMAVALLLFSMLRFRKRLA